MEKNTLFYSISRLKTTQATDGQLAARNSHVLFLAPSLSPRPPTEHTSSHRSVHSQPRQIFVSVHTTPSVISIRRRYVSCVCVCSPRMFPFSPSLGSPHITSLPISGSLICPCPRARVINLVCFVSLLPLSCFFFLFLFLIFDSCTTLFAVTAVIFKVNGGLDCTCLFANAIPCLLLSSYFILVDLIFSLRRYFSLSHRANN